MFTQGVKDLREIAANFRVIINQETALLTSVIPLINKIRTVRYTFPNVFLQSWQSLFPKYLLGFTNFYTLFTYDTFVSLYSSSIAMLGTYDYVLQMSHSSIYKHDSYLYSQ